MKKKRIPTGQKQTWNGKWKLTVGITLTWRRGCGFNVFPGTGGIWTSSLNKARFVSVWKKIPRT